MCCKSHTGRDRWEEVGGPDKAGPAGQGKESTEELWPTWVCPQSVPWGVWESPLES